MSETRATDEMVEAAARTSFEDTIGLPGDYTWAEMVVEDPTRADLWRQDARTIVNAALAVAPTSVELARLRAHRDAVLALHIRQETRNGPVCQECLEPETDEGCVSVEWPCLTVRALEGEELAGGDGAGR